MTNTADPKAVAKAQRKQDRDAEKLDAALRWLFDDEKGRRIAWWLLEETHVFRTSMTGNSQTFFLEGERNIGLKVLDRLMTISPSAFALMQAEAREEPPEPLAEKDQPAEI